MRIKSRHDPLAKLLAPEDLRELSGGSKYHAERVTNEYGTFDSKHEYSVFLDLLILERAGEIVKIERQVKFDLIPAQDGEKPVCYKADFVVTYQDGTREIIDAKGMRTKEYILKRKLMLWVHGIKIKEV